MSELQCEGLGGVWYTGSPTCEPNPCSRATLQSAQPANQGSLWRSRKNISRITFDRDLPSTPTAGQIEINELLPGGAFGPDLSSSFTFDAEGGRVLRIQDTGATLQHRKWYAIRNVGNWPGMARFWGIPRTGRVLRIPTTFFLEV